VKIIWQLGGVSPLPSMSSEIGKTTPHHEAAPLLKIRDPTPHQEAAPLLTSNDASSDAPPPDSSMLANILGAVQKTYEDLQGLTSHQLGEANDLPPDRAALERESAIGNLYHNMVKFADQTIPCPCGEDGCVVRLQENHLVASCGFIYGGDYASEEPETRNYRDNDMGGGADKSRTEERADQSKVREETEISASDLLHPNPDPDPDLLGCSSKKEALSKTDTRLKQCVVLFDKMSNEEPGRFSLTGDEKRVAMGVLRAVCVEWGTRRCPETTRKKAEAARLAAEAAAAAEAAKKAKAEAAEAAKKAKADPETAGGSGGGDGASASTSASESASPNFWCCAIALELVAQRSCGFTVPRQEMQTAYTMDGLSSYIKQQGGRSVTTKEKEVSATRAPNQFKAALQAAYPTKIRQARWDGLGKDLASRIGKMELLNELLIGSGVWKGRGLSVQGYVEGRGQFTVLGVPTVRDAYRVSSPSTIPADGGRWRLLPVAPWNPPFAKTFPKPPARAPTARAPTARAPTARAPTARAPTVRAPTTRASQDEELAVRASQDKKLAVRSPFQAAPVPRAIQKRSLGQQLSTNPSRAQMKGWKMARAKEAEAEAAAAAAAAAEAAKKAEAEAAKKEKNAKKAKKEMMVWVQATAKSAESRKAWEAKTPAQRMAEANAARTNQVSLSGQARTVEEYLQAVEIEIAAEEFNHLLKAAEVADRGLARFGAAIKPGSDGGVIMVSKTNRKKRYAGKTFTKNCMRCNREFELHVGGPYQSLQNCPRKIVCKQLGTNCPPKS
jgi:hypothetical protein